MSAPTPSYEFGELLAGAIVALVSAIAAWIGGRRHERKKNGGE